MATRPSLGRDDSYNRVTVSSDLKSQIMSMIADSSESLPLPSLAESEEEAPAATTTTEPAVDKSHLAVDDALNSADIPTPTPDKPNPLDAVTTDSLGATASRATTASQTPSSTVDGKKEGRPGMDKRQSTMKRLSTAFKRTVSKA